jgi:hypothetical protein
MTRRTNLWNSWIGFYASLGLVVLVSYVALARVLWFSNSFDLGPTTAAVGTMSVDQMLWP